MRPGKDILGQGAGHGASVKNGHWAGAGSPAILGSGWGFAPGPLGTARGGEEGASLGAVRGKGLGHGQDRRAAAISVCQELPWLLKMASNWWVTVFLAKYRGNWIVNTVSAYLSYPFSRFLMKVIRDSTKFSV